jgi:hypothetical protein
MKSGACGRRRLASLTTPQTLIDFWVLVQVSNEPYLRPIEHAGYLFGLPKWRPRLWFVVLKEG